MKDYENVLSVIDKLVKDYELSNKEKDEFDK